jgi:heme-degrading monooxygenase HmoA
VKIARIWKARAIPDNAPRYVAYFEAHVVPELKAITGYEGATVMVRAGDVVEVTVVTRWESMKAVEAFAGDPVDAAVVHPAAAALLTDYDRHVVHCEIAFDQHRTP